MVSSNGLNGGLNGGLWDWKYIFLLIRQESWSWCFWGVYLILKREIRAEIIDSSPRSIFHSRWCCWHDVISVTTITFDFTDTFMDQIPQINTPQTYCAVWLERVNITKWLLEWASLTDQLTEYLCIVSRSSTAAKPSNQKLSAHRLSLLLNSYRCVLVRSHRWKGKERE